VTDNGRGPRGTGDRGHGLVGMRERVALYHGDFDAGVRNGGGFVVPARLPFAASEARASASSSRTTRRSSAPAFARSSRRIRRSRVSAGPPLGAKPTGACALAPPQASLWR